ncbi:ATP-binding protein [Candidatus Uhrbacteria bacterium]|nr:ATP-binding protein [Candidatus Uhrbacteria bacterium]
MKKDFILKEIFRQNRHWENPDEFFFDIEHIEYQRTLYFSLVPALKKRQIISLVGLRRVGKTVLLKQLIKNLLSNVDAEAILFLSFDEVLFPKDVTLADYIDAYLEHKAPKDTRLTIFLDEIQYAKQWHHILKRYYDTEPNIKFIISGSSSLFLQKKTTETLAGRIEEFFLPVLSFEEYLSLKRVSTILVDAYQGGAVTIGDSAAHALRHERITAQYGNDLIAHFDDFLRFGQFPELIGTEETGAKQKYLEESIFKKTVEYDIPRIFGVEKVDELKFLFAVILSETGLLSEPTNLAREIGIDAATVKKYLSYFEQSFLVYPLHNYSKSFRKSRRLLKKLYLGSSNFLSLFTDWRDSEISRQRTGFMVENYVFSLLRRQFRFCSFYRVRSHEFDFLCSNDMRDTRAFQHIEVKWREHIDMRDIPFLTRVAKKHNAPMTVISRMSHALSSDITVIPAWLLK